MAPSPIRAHILPSPAAALVRSSLVLTMLATAAIGITAAVHRFWRVDDVLGAVLPFDTRLTDPLDAALGTVAFAALALGLAQRRRLSWLLAVALLAVAVAVQSLVLHHAVGALVGGAGLLALLTGQRSFGVRSGRHDLALLAVVAMGVAAVVLDAVLVANARHPIPATARALTDIAGSLIFTDVRALAVIDARPSVLEIPVTALRALVALLAVLALVAAPLFSVGESSRRRFERLAEQYGQGALLPYQLGPDKAAFSPADVDGAVVFGQAGRFAVALGDPVGAPVQAWAAFRRFDDACRTSGLVPTVYQASSSSRDQLLRLGYHAILIGREAIIPLEGFSLAGSGRANLRHTVTRARRGGITVEVHLDGLDADALGRLRPGLEAIDARWRQRSGPELGFTIGRFDASALDSTAIAVALEADGTPTAFATFLPTGVDDGWVLDLMRRLPGGTPGAFEACLASAAEAMRDRGSRTLSLGLAPLAGLSSDSVVPEERLLARVSRHIRPAYDVAGLEFFKAKFDPVWEPRYAAARSRLQLVGLIMALLRLHIGGFRHAAGAALRATLRRTA